MFLTIKANYTHAVGLSRRLREVKLAGFSSIGCLDHPVFTDTWYAGTQDLSCPRPIHCTQCNHHHQPLPSHHSPLQHSRAFLWNSSKQREELQAGTCMAGQILTLCRGLHGRVAGTKASLCTAAYQPLKKNTTKSTQIKMIWNRNSLSLEGFWSYSNATYFRKYVETVRPLDLLPGDARECW